MNYVELCWIIKQNIKSSIISGDVPHNFKLNSSESRMIKFSRINLTYFLIFQLS